MRSSATVYQLIRFAVVGGGVMLFFTAMNWVLGRWFSAQIAFLLAYPPALALHFALNKWWTFGCGRQDTTKQVAEYLLMVLVTFVIQWGVFTALTGWTSWPGWLAAGAANAAQMIVTYLAMKRRIFSRAASV